MKKLYEYAETWDGLLALVTDGVTEGPHLDFKRDAYSDSRKPLEKREADKEELRRDATAFANGGGGRLLIGVAEDAQGRACSVPGIENAAAHENNMRDVLSRSIDPPFTKSALRVRTVFDPQNATRGVVVVEIGESKVGFPHAVQGKSDAPLDFWIRTDKSKRRMTYLQVRASFQADEELAAQQRLDSMALVEIRKIKYAIRSASWDFGKMVSLLEPLRIYVADLNFGPPVHSEVIAAAGEVLSVPRAGLTPEAARAAVDIINEALPVYSLVGRAPEPPSPDDVALFRQASDYGWGLVYDGVKYLNSLPVISTGARLLGRLLRYCHLNEVTEVKDEVLEHFERARQVAKERRREHAIKVLDFFQHDALDDREGPPVPMPDGLEWVILGRDAPNKKKRPQKRRPRQR
ncbi:helix-turn-helix domain-containing protein [Archangium sp.]|uniref:AlbA family DNA-binding domain-containing protein n=1 Tax=Archangium sp. TaxID=1872627 RepID=UPI003899F039